jgi:Anti-sigma-K factor rskA, C-terminal
MSHPDLVSLLRGGLSNADALEAGAHLEDCVACRDELAELAVGHAMLLGAVRTNDEAVRGDDVLPQLRVSPGRRSRRRTVLAAVAAVVILLAGVTCAGLILRSADQGTAPTPAADVPLAPVGGEGSGTVAMSADGSRTRMTVTTAGLPVPGSNQYYYAWLLDPRTNKMLPLGQVDADGATSFDLDGGLVAAYDAVDVSLEKDDGDPAHSATSVLRGGYESP